MSIRKDFLRFLTPGLEGCTYTCKLDTAVAALWCSSSLLDVKVTELTTWGLDHADLVGLGVVSVSVFSVCSSFVHFRSFVLSHRFVEGGLTVACGAVKDVSDCSMDFKRGSTYIGQSVGRHFGDMCVVVWR